MKGGKKEAAPPEVIYTKEWGAAQSTEELFRPAWTESRGQSKKNPRSKLSTRRAPVPRCLGIAFCVD